MDAGREQRESPPTRTASRRTLPRRQMGLRQRLAQERRVCYPAPSAWPAGGQRQGLPGSKRVQPLSLPRRKRPHPGGSAAPVRDGANHSAASASGSGASARASEAAEWRTRHRACVFQQDTAIEASWTNKMAPSRPASDFAKIVDLSGAEPPPVRCFSFKTAVEIQQSRSTSGGKQWSKARWAVSPLANAANGWNWTAKNELQKLIG